jgi:hypothetical protein
VWFAFEFVLKEVVLGVVASLHLHFLALDTLWAADDHSNQRLPVHFSSVAVEVPEGRSLVLYMRAAATNYCSF